MQSLRKEKTPLRTEQRGVVNFCARLGRSPSETQTLLQEAYKQDALRKAATKTYYKRFQTLGAAVYEDKRKAKGSKSRLSAAEYSDDDSQNEDLNSSGPHSSYLVSNWDPLIPQASKLDNETGIVKQMGEYPNNKLQTIVANKEECCDFDDDLTDILEDSLQEDQRSVSECETDSEDTNITSSIAGETCNEALSDVAEEVSQIDCIYTTNQHSERVASSKMYGVDSENNSNNSLNNYKLNKNIDKYEQNTCIKCRNIITDTLHSNQIHNISNDSDKYPANILRRNVESKYSSPSTKDLNHNENYENTSVNEVCTSTHNVESPPHITRENAIRQPSAINWFIRLNGECWKIKSYQVCR